MQISQRNYVIPGSGGQSLLVQAPSVANVQGNYAVTLNQMEQSNQALYDTVTYPAAGATQLRFFAIPSGQSGKTNSDTNLTIGGQIPSTQKFLVSRISIGVYPNQDGTGQKNSITATAATASQQINDVASIISTGNLTFTIADKVYVQDGPLDRFPPPAHMRIDSSIGLSQADQAAPSITEVLNAVAQSSGQTYDLDPNNLLIDANMSFSVTLNWPEGLQALVAAPARIKCWLDGVLFRNVQ